MNRSAINRMTVEPLVSDNPKCQVKVIAYGSWSLTRASIILGQNISSLACYG